MAWPSTLTWKLAEPLQKYLSKNSPFKGADWKAELDNIYNGINYISANSMGEPLADIAALRLVPPESSGPTATDVPRRDGQLRRINSVIGPSASTSTQIYQFKAASATADADAGDLDTDGIVSPTTGTGRWHRVPSNALYNRGADGLVTFYRNAIIDLNTDTYGDIALKVIGKSASSYIRFTFNKAFQFRDGSDADYQDVTLKGLTATGNITAQGTNNTFTGTPPTSAILALLQLGSAPVGASSAGTYKSINAGSGFTGDFHNYQVNGTTKQRVDYLGNFISTGQNHQFHANPQASATKSIISLVADIVSGNASGTGFGANFANGYAGDIFNFQVNNSTILKAFSDGRVKGTAANNGDEFTTKDQATSIATNSIKWGSGADGAVSLSGTVTLTEDKHYTTCAIADSTTINLNGYNIYARTSIIGGNNIVLALGTGAAGSAGSSSAGGSGGINTTGSNPSLNGADGAHGTTNSFNTHSSVRGQQAVTPEAGVDGANGGAGEGTSGIKTGGVHYELSDSSDYLTLISALKAGLFANGGAAAGGGGGGAVGIGGGGGGGGAASPTSALISPIITFGTGCSVTGVGGAGGAGETSANGDGGGGGGGSGGLLVKIYETLTLGAAFSTTLTGGAGGAAGGAGASAGSNGTAGYIQGYDVG